MIEPEIHAALAEIQAGAREGRAWRERADARLDQTAESLNLLSHSLAELSTEMKLHLHYGQDRIGRLEERVNALDPLSTATPKTAVAVGGGGFFGWLAGGGWEQITHFLKRILP